MFWKHNLFKVCNILIINNKMRIPRETPDENAAPFNMALATLERISKILIKTTENSTDPNILEDERQKNGLFLLKQLYINSAPLLKQPIVEKFEYVLKLEMKQVNLLGKHHSGSTYTKNKTFIYSIELEIEINKALIYIQQELQREKYFMPPKYDISSGYDQLR